MQFKPQLILMSAGFDGHYSERKEHTLHLYEVCCFAAHLFGYTYFDEISGVDIPCLLLCMYALLYI